LNIFKLLLLILVLLTVKPSVGVSEVKSASPDSEKTTDYDPHKFVFAFGINPLLIGFFEESKTPLIMADHYMPQLLVASIYGKWKVEGLWGINYLNRHTAWQVSWCLNYCVETEIKDGKRSTSGYSSNTILSFGYYNFEESRRIRKQRYSSAVISQKLGKYSIGLGMLTSTRSNGYLTSLGYEFF
jgi:hypothetical protein